MAADSIDQKRGVLNKCPSCGGPLKAFASVCELCGHELAEVGANKTIMELVKRFTEIESELDRSGLRGSNYEKELASRKARVIRDFPIPNSREDLQSLIYFIHPKIQDGLKPDPNAEDWRVKFSEVLSLAKNAYKGDAKTRTQFEEIERSLNTSLVGSLQTRAKRNPIVTIAVAGVILIALGGIGVAQYDKWKLKACEDRFVADSNVERTRLEGVLKEAMSMNSDGRFKDSSAAAEKLGWRLQAACKGADAAQAEALWDHKRNEMIALIQQTESKALAEKKVENDKIEAAKHAETKREEEKKRAMEESRVASKMASEAGRENAARKAAIKKEW